MVDRILAKADEVAEMLQISKSQVYALAWDGTLPSVRFGPKCVRFPLEQIRRRIEELTVRADTPVSR